MRRGVATFTLDTGHCPPWLYERMVKLGRELVTILVAEFGPVEFLRRIADPVWFQSLGTVLAFDWNASGLTTILTAALKEAIRGQERELQIFICGGKGKTSRKTPQEITTWAERLSLPNDRVKKWIYTSKMAAKVDSSLIQDSFELYHHAFFFTPRGAWTVVQQGMNSVKRRARRYHWFSENIHDLIEEPHSGIISDLTTSGKNLNMASKESRGNRQRSLDIVHSGFYRTITELQILRKHSSRFSKMITLKKNSEQLTLLELPGMEFHHHPVELEDFSKSKYLEKILWKICDRKPESYEKMLALDGVGAKTIRALALVSEVLYGAPASYEDPARYSFAHGGKDGTPYLVDRKTYDESIGMLKKSVLKTKLSRFEKQKVLQRLEI